MDIQREVLLLQVNSEFNDYNDICSFKSENIREYALDGIRKIFIGDKETTDNALTQYVNSHKDELIPIVDELNSYSSENEDTETRYLLSETLITTQYCVKYNDRVKRLLTSISPLFDFKTEQKLSNITINDTLKETELQLLSSADYGIRVYKTTRELNGDEAGSEYHQDTSKPVCSFMNFGELNKWIEQNQETIKPIIKDNYSQNAVYKKCIEEHTAEINTNDTQFLNIPIFSYSINTALQVRQPHNLTPEMLSEKEINQRLGINDNNSSIKMKI